eukprot:CAMPEP_0115860836 /NCGR_PEP_ID=MMETSP0287-20121206/17337_1 /TAXON_ID=412157 /ORGANISM="Chrysochromulina rotalis, Strain UIO044" /LENGTH=110 /DNA_ID=CAMNT_0003315181 /DNA_START=214 /DNA_END=546 /DNA_ORIENTATION=+
MHGEQDLARGDASVHSCGKLEASIQPPVQRVDLFSWWREAFSDHCRDITRDPLRYVLITKVVRLRASRKGAADEHSSVVVRVQHRPPLLPSQKAEVVRVVQDGFSRARLA